MKTYIGIDWGTRINPEDSSTINVCILKLSGRIFGHMENIIINKNRFEDQVSEIEKLINISEADGIVVSHIALVQTQILQAKFGEKVKSCYYGVPEGHMKYNKDMWMISVFRDSIIYEAMKAVGLPFHRPMISTDALHALNFAYVAFVVGEGEAAASQLIQVAA